MYDTDTKGIWFNARAAGRDPVLLEHTEQVSGLAGALSEVEGEASQAGSSSGATCSGALLVAIGVAGAVGVNHLVGVGVEDHLERPLSGCEKHYERLVL